MNVNSIFADFSPSSPKINNYNSKPAVFQSQDSANVEKETKAQEKTKEKTKGKAAERFKTIAPIVIPLAAIPITALVTYKISNKNIKGLTEQVKTLTSDLSTIKEESANQIKILNESIKNQSSTIQKDNSKIWTALLAAAGLGGAYKAGQLNTEDKDDIAKKAGNKINDLSGKVNYAIDSSHQALASGNRGHLAKKYTKEINGIPLMINNDSLNKNSKKYDEAIKSIRNEAPKHLYNAPELNSINKEHPVIWSITSEFAPIKEGGLGSYKTMP